MKQENTNRRRRKGGRPAKSDLVTECVMVRFNAREYARFLTLTNNRG